MATETIQEIILAPYGKKKDGSAHLPNPTQQKVLDWVDKQRHAGENKTNIPVLYLQGGVGSGKSRAMLAPIIEMLLEIPDLRVLWGRNDFKDIKLSIMDKFFEIVPNEIVGDKSEQYHWYDIKQPDDSIGRIYFNGLKDLSGFSSQEFGVIAITETYEITEQAYRTLKRRCRQENAPNIILMEGEAPNEDHWLARLTDPEHEDYDPDIEMWTVDTYENWGNLPEAYKGSLESMPESWKKKYLKGGFGFIPDGAPFYQGFKETFHTRVLTGNKHKPLILGWDYGYRHPAPYVADTEVLTSKGWKFIKDVEVGEHIASMNPSSRKIEYQAVTDKVEHFYEGKMYGWSNGQNYGVDVEVTANHNLAIEQDGKLSLIEAQELADAPIIPRGTHKSNSNAAWYETFAPLAQQDGMDFISPIEGITQEVFARFMGIWLSEGSLAAGYSRKGREHGLRHYNTWVWQKDEKPEIVKLLGEMPLKWSRQKKGGWVTANKDMFIYLSLFGKSHDKYVPQCIKDAKPEIIKEFIEFYTLGDGDAKGRITTVSAQMADDIQELFIKIGVHAVISKDRDTYKIKPRLKYRPSFSRIKPKIRETSGEYVYCVTVPNHIICVRRNGKPLWCGNCLVTQLDAKGRWLILREIMGDNITIDQFADVVKEELATRFPGFEIQDFGYGDPAGEAKTDKSEDTSVEILNSKGFKVMSTTSTYRTRKEIIEGKLATLIQGIPALVVNSTGCKTVVDGFLGGYHYPVIKQGQAHTTIKTESPFHDGFYSHLMNCLEYIAVNMFKPVVRATVSTTTRKRRYHELTKKGNAGFGFKT